MDKLKQQFDTSDWTFTCRKVNELINFDIISIFPPPPFLRTFPTSWTCSTAACSRACSRNMPAAVRRSPSTKVTSHTFGRGWRTRFTRRSCSDETGWLNLMISTEKRRHGPVFTHHLFSLLFVYLFVSFLFPRIIYFVFADQESAFHLLTIVDEDCNLYDITCVHLYILFNKKTFLSAYGIIFINFFAHKIVYLEFCWIYLLIH